ncbi:c-type cytochrome [Magnetococcales bacterium HHB-1]
MASYRDFLAIAGAMALIGFLVFLLSFLQEHFESDLHHKKESEAADRVRGQHLARSCASCHDMSRSKRTNKVGPPLWNIIDKPASISPDYHYSEAQLKKSIQCLKWDRETLDKYLKNPRAFIPGNKMAFAGMRNEADRRLLLNYLETLRDEKEGSAPPNLEPYIRWSLFQSIVYKNPEMHKKLLAQGERIVKERCASCHDITPKKFNLKAPALWKVWNRSIASVENYPYSKEINLYAAKHFFWTEYQLCVYLKRGDPLFAKGDKRHYIKDDMQRAAVLGYLSTQH